jgi:hypothetical protein
VISRGIQLTGCPSVRVSVPTSPRAMCMPPWHFLRYSGRYWPARLSTRSPAGDLYLRLPQPHSVQPAPGTRSPTQPRAYVADWRLMPDFKTIANFRKDNSKTIRGVCRQFVVLCQQLGLFGENLVAIDGSKLKAVNNRDRNFTSAKLKRRMEKSNRASTVTSRHSIPLTRKSPNPLGPEPCGWKR